MTIQYSGPAIDPEMPWEIRRHIQLLYQKLGNHTQAFQEVTNQIAGIKGGTTTTIIEGGGGSTPVPPPSTGFLGQGLINDQSGQTSYATGPGDNGILLVLNDASPVSVTLTTASAPYYLIITNFGAGTVTLSPSTGFINGGASLSLLQSQTVYVACDSTNWKTAEPGGITQLTGDVTAGSGSGSQAATLKVATVGWTVLDGSTANDLGNIQSMLRAANLSVCVVTVTASDAATDLTFDIQQNGTSAFATPPTVTHGATRGQQFSFALRLASLPVAFKDLFNLNITAGSSAWKFSLFLE